MYFAYLSIPLLLPFMSSSTMPFQEGQLENLLADLSQLPTYSIGRKNDNTIVIANGKISGQHARLIQCTSTRFILEDLASKNGSFVNGIRITRKIIDKTDRVQLADADYTVDQLLALQRTPAVATAPVAIPPKVVLPEPNPASDKPALDFTGEFAELQQAYKQYPKLRRDCRNREKMIRTGSVLLSSVVGVGTALATGGVALPFLQIISSAGLSVLIPTLCSTLLSTEEKLEILDKEYRERYRCPNPACRDPFVPREWELLAQQKTCRRCQAVWVN